MIILLIMYLYLCGGTVGSPQGRIRLNACGLAVGHASSSSMETAMTAMKNDRDEIVAKDDGIKAASAAKT